MLLFKIKCHFLNTDLVLYSLSLGLIYENAFKVIALMLYDIPHQLINLRCPRAFFKEPACCLPMLPDNYSCVVRGFTGQYVITVRVTPSPQ